jgi:hypothetical protein
MATVWYMKDYDSKEWVLKHTVSNDELWSVTAVGYKVAAIHPDCDTIFLIHLMLIHWHHTICNVANFIISFTLRRTSHQANFCPMYLSTQTHLQAQMVSSNICNPRFCFLQEATKLCCWFLDLLGVISFSWLVLTLLLPWLLVGSKDKIKRIREVCDEEWSICNGLMLY